MQEEKNIKELLEHASLKDLAPDFDRDEAWVAMQERMPAAEPAKKKTIWLGWYSHAAAVVLGILLTYGFFSLKPSAAIHDLAADYNKRPPVAPRPEKGREQEWRKLQRSNDSLKLLLASLEQTKQPAPALPKPHQAVPDEYLAQRQAPAQKASVPAAGNIPDPVTPPMEEAPVAVADPAPKLKVTHYMDVNNEDQSIMVRPAPVVFEKKIRLRVNKPESKTYRPEQSVLPLRELFTVSQ